MQEVSQTVPTTMLTMTYKHALNALYQRKLDHEMEVKLGAVEYFPQFMSIRMDLGYGTGKSTAAAEFARDNLGTLLVVKTDALANQTRRKYRHGNVMSMNQYQHYHCGSSAGLSMVIFDDCKPAQHPLFVKVAYLGVGAR